MVVEVCNIEVSITVKCNVSGRVKCCGPPKAVGGARSDSVRAATTGESCDSACNDINDADKVIVSVSDIQSCSSITSDARRIVECRSSTNAIGGTACDAANTPAASKRCDGARGDGYCTNEVVCHICEVKCVACTVEAYPLGRVKHCDCTDAIRTSRCANTPSKQCNYVCCLVNYS